MRAAIRLLPRSLIGRVFALYSAALLLFVAGGLAIMSYYQYTYEMDRSQWHADSIGAVAAQTVTDSAVIGDYDTIARTLERATYHTDLAEAAFIDVKGGKVSSSRNEAPETRPPAWLQRAIERRLYDTNLPIGVGGKDYGILRLSFATDRIAGNLWRQIVYATWLAAAALLGGLLVIRMPLVRWLGNINNIRSLEETMKAGSVGAVGDMLSADAPIEFRKTYEVLRGAALTIQAEREQASVTLGAIADAVFTLDAQGKVVYVNAAVQAVFQRSPQSFLGQDIHEAFPDLFRCGDALVPWHGRHASLTLADGGVVVVDTTMSSIVGADGQARGHVLTGRDVTETNALNQRLSDEVQLRESALTALRQVLEDLMPAVPLGPEAAGDDLEAISHLISELVRRLRERGEQLTAIFELSPDGFVSFDAGRVIRYVSPTFTRLTGLKETQVLGIDEARFGALLNSIRADSSPALPGFESMRSRGEGGDERELIELAPPLGRVLELGLRQGGSDAVAQVLYLRDVTHETEVDRMKSEFLSTAAHELRTPMTSIYGFTELMMQREMPPERQRQIIETVHRQTEQVITIVNELLDLARIESRRGKDFVIESLDLAALVQSVVSDYKPPQARTAPRLDLPPSAVMVRADRDKTVQVIFNVLSNAYKYSPQGGDVWVRSVQRVAEGLSGVVQAGIEVEDHGIGMTEAQLARVGERFYRADTSGSIPGTGLGVSIVKEVLELQGGRLEVFSEYGKGTRVRLWWPCAQDLQPVTNTLLAA